MIYVLAFIFLVTSELAYFRIADKYNIIDKPNHRSLHTDITIRGGGIIFVISAFIFFFYSNFKYSYFFLALFLIAFISFWDDVKSLPNRYRIIIQFLSIFLLCVELNLFESIGAGLIPLIIIMVGIVNAYNFMDGINGITGGYSFILFMTLLYINNYHVNFVENQLIVFSILGLIIFNFFNFRNKARCFAGDVGSVSIAFIIIFLLAKLIFQTGNFVYILLLTVYGVDSIFTIVERLWHKENIFEAHRKHFFQVLVYNGRLSHVQVAIIYMIIQSILNICLLIILNQGGRIYYMFIIVFILCFAYISIKKNL
jgi:UDP-N-acetylmuramyl pentapeptide phosphotransferase/UDP-N-acetylglucosamine-1-phosphate transferase